MRKKVGARLVLEDGTEYAGLAFGKARAVAGEVVFTTGMTGYPETLSDPSYYGQILVATYPLIGNYGVPLDAKTLTPQLDGKGIPLCFESDRVQVSGLVVSELCDAPSHFSSTATLAVWLEKNNVPGISGIDTRALTQHIRECGAMRGKIIVEGKSDVRIDSGDIENPVEKVSIAETITYKSEKSGALKIVLVDCGVKANILRCLLDRGVELIRVPWNHDLTGIDYDGIFLSNGPGDPKACGKTIAAVRGAFSRGKPVFGICLGNQIMALAAGGDTYKLPYGHRAQNQPCIELEEGAGTEGTADGTGRAAGRCYITSQNHGYAVRAESLPRGWEPWFINANDGTVEGVRSANAPFSAVQFHPEGSPGPRDTEFLIDRFLRQCGQEAKI